MTQKNDFLVSASLNLLFNFEWRRNRLKFARKRRQETPSNGVNKFSDAPNCVHYTQQHQQHWWLNVNIYCVASVQLEAKRSALFPRTLIMEKCRSFCLALNIMLQVYIEWGKRISILLMWACREKSADVLAPLCVSAIYDFKLNLTRSFYIIDGIEALILPLFAAFDIYCHIQLCSQTFLHSLLRFVVCEKNAHPYVAKVSEPKYYTIQKYSNPCFQVLDFISTLR